MGMSITRVVSRDDLSGSLLLILRVYTQFFIDIFDNID